LLLAGLEENSLVSDPFNGSGTTGIACKILGHRYIGYEINPHYVQYARKWLSDY